MIECVSEGRGDLQKFFCVINMALNTNAPGVRSKIVDQRKACLTIGLSRGAEFSQSTDRSGGRCWRVADERNMDGIHHQPVSIQSSVQWSNFQNIFGATLIHRTAKAGHIYFLKFKGPSLQLQAAGEKLVGEDCVCHIRVKCTVPGENVRGLHAGGFEFNLHERIRCTEKFRRAL